jgi:hypothetical protein
MCQLRDTSLNQLFGMFRMTRAESAESACLQSSMQKCTQILFEAFRSSLVLVRAYATVEFRCLPPADREFVTTFAVANDVDELINDDTPVFSLLGTQGMEPAWNDRTKSRRHLGLPLVSTQFVRTFPMVARIMDEMGIGLGWIDERGSPIVIQHEGTTAGVFYVSDAANAVDSQARNIIPAQDFVAKYGVRTVFGIGGEYLNRMFITILLFTREDVPRTQAENFMPLIYLVKAATIKLATSGLIYT